MADSANTRNLPSLSHRSFAALAALVLPFLTAGGVEIARAAVPHPDAELFAAYSRWLETHAQYVAAVDHACALEGQCMDRVKHHGAPKAEVRAPYRAAERLANDVYYDELGLTTDEIVIEARSMRAFGRS